MVSRDGITTIAIAGLAAATLGTVLAVNYFRPQSNLESKVSTSYEQRDRKVLKFEQNQGMAMPAEVYLDKDAVVMGNQVLEEVAPAYRDILDQRKQENFEARQIYQIFGKEMDDTIENVDNVGLVTADEARNALRMIKEIKKTSKTRNEQFERIRLAFPLDFAGSMVEEQEQAERGYDKPREYGNGQPQRNGPTGQLSDKSTWDYMFPK